MVQTHDALSTRSTSGASGGGTTQRRNIENEKCIMNGKKKKEKKTANLCVLQEQYQHVKNEKHFHVRLLKKNSF